LFTLFVVPAMYLFLGTDHARQAAAQAAVPAVAKTGQQLS